MKVLSENRRAQFDYDILERYEAGIELIGSEVKSIRHGRMGLRGSYAVPRGDELVLLNADVPPYQVANAPQGYTQKRSRRLLLHRKELDYLLGRLKEKQYALIPLKAYLAHSLIKIELGLGRSRKKKDKRELLKKRAAAREIKEAF